jgi:[ribosomal protein S5]-alanine N-acetyltransferase
MTARLHMRPFRLGDVEAGFALWSDPQVGRFTGGAHRSREQSRALVVAHLDHQRRAGFSLWAVEERDGGALVGEAGLQLLEMRGPEIEIGWSVAPSRWGRGYATEAARAWLDVGLGELGLDRIVATILPENAPSHAVAARLGMRYAERRHVHGAEHMVYAISAVPGTRPAAASSGWPR